MSIGGLVVGLLVEVVLPEVDDLELGLLAVGQAVEVLASRLIARAAADHLPELDARLHGFMKTRLTTSGTSMPVSSMSTEMAMRGRSFFLNLVMRPSP